MITYVVYVIRSYEGYTYTGYTKNLDKRIKEHNDHNLSFWSKRGSDWKIVYSEEFQSISEAMKYEKWLKSGIGREFLKKLLSK